MNSITTNHFALLIPTILLFPFVQLSFKGMDDEGVDMDMDGRQCSQVYK